VGVNSGPGAGGRYVAGRVEVGERAKEGAGLAAADTHAHCQWQAASHPASH